MAHGLNSVIKRGVASVNCKNEGGKGVGSRRIFAPHFKLQVLDSYRNDADCKGNQRATARKYGIHRRQIQKWLQVENTLRNSVSNAKEKASITITENGMSEDKKSYNDFEVALNGINRQRDDNGVGSASSASGAEARVPALTQAAAPYVPPLPLDFTTHGRATAGHTSPIVATSDSPLASPDPAAPIDLSFKRPTLMAADVGAPVCCYVPLSPPLTSSPEYLPGVWDLSTKTSKRKCPSPPLVAAKPVKLFKPYLDVLKEPQETTLIKLEPCCTSATLSCDGYFYNNNNVCDSGYTLHELQPRSINYYYSPYSTDYDVGPCCYEDISYGQNGSPLRTSQRQSYSLDFKLSAIDCYYQDSVCKGNQRAVATKFNIHRRQVQKWLQQAEELKLRNESMKQLHAVR